MRRPTANGLEKALMKSKRHPLRGAKARRLAARIRRLRAEYALRLELWKFSWRMHHEQVNDQ